MKHVCNPRFSMSMSFSSKGNQISQFLKAFSSMATPNPSLISRPSSLTSVSNAPQRSDEWFTLRRDRLTTSTFSTALGFWKNNRRTDLWHEKVFASVEDNSQSKPCATLEWGVLNESAAVEQYKKITNNNVSFMGFAVHSDEKLSWLGASPDGLLNNFPNGGILEVKCPYNNGKPEIYKPWSAMPYYYMPQVQGQMEVMDRDWVDLYCWTPNGSSLFRVYRDRGYWELIYGVLSEFWWENVVPAREAVLLGEEEKVYSFKPGLRHERTGQVIVSSVKLAVGAKMLCRETAGNVELYAQWPVSF